MSEKTRKTVRIIALIALIISVGLLAFYAADDIRSKNTDDKLQDLKGTQPTFTIPDVLPEYEALCAENPDTIGWLKIDGTGIDNVVMYAPDESHTSAFRISYQSLWSCAPCKNPRLHST